MRGLPIALFCAAILSGCAFPAQVRQFGVEYNGALADMQNEQTLLNVLRARDGMPTHFTSVSQFRGSINLTAGASLNAQLRGAGLTSTMGSGTSLAQTTTATTTTALAAPGAMPSTSNVASVVATPGSTTTASNVIAEGVDLYTPQISGQIVTGTNFDVAVFDTQRFYQGMLGAIPFTTVESFLNQGLDDRILMHLLIARVDFRLGEDIVGYPPGKGAIVLSVKNAAFGGDDWRVFSQFTECFSLGSGTVARKTTDIAAMSRFTRGADGKIAPLALDKIGILDGERFELSRETGLTDTGDGDANIVLRRISPERRVARLGERAPLCDPPGTQRQSITLSTGAKVVNVPITPGPDPIYLGDGKALVFVGGALQEVKVDIEITFRSTEAVFRYLGSYLREASPPVVGGIAGPLFAICKGNDAACGGVEAVLARATYNKTPYRLVRDSSGGVRSAQVFTLLQQLVNLHKEAADKPITLPVRAVP